MDIRALYEIKRQSFLIGFVQSPTRFNAALAYAYQNRISPIFHEQAARAVYGEDPFEDAYSIKSAFVNEVASYIAERWQASDLAAVQFKKLETRFGGNRMQLLHIIEYARMAGMFDDPLYNAIEANAPMNANSFLAKFEPEDVYFG